MRPRLPSSRLDRLRAEDGIGLVEVLVAMVLLTVGVLGLIGGFTSARKLTLLSERHTSMAHRAQLEIERLQATPYNELAMHEAPSHSNETTNPDYYVNSSPTTCTSVGDGCYAWNAESLTEEEPLVKPEIGEGAIATKPTSRKCPEKLGACEWQDGSLKGNVYDFVTWHHDTNTACAKTENYKRLTVVVTLNVPSGSKAVNPVRVSTLIAKPNETKEEFKTC
jgi:Tfp pilus assembly protein PilV